MGGNGRRKQKLKSHKKRFDWNGHLAIQTIRRGTGGTNKCCAGVSHSKYVLTDICLKSKNFEEPMYVDNDLWLHQLVESDHKTRHERK